MSETNIKSTYISYLDTQWSSTYPATYGLQNTAGQGAVGKVCSVEGWAAVSAAGIGASASYYRLVRFPTRAMIKTVEIASDVAIDSNSSQQLALDFNIAFSDSAYDYTPTALQGLIPKTALDGTCTSFSSYSTPNLLFGTKTYSGNNAVIAKTDITFNSTVAGQLFPKWYNIPLWQYFGFTNGQGTAYDPGGNFDLTAYTSTAAATGHAGNLWCKVSYVLG